MPVEYRYLGPDGSGIEALPEGTGAAIGSEYCVHLLPSAGRLFSLCTEAARRRIPLLLLTPYFRDDELKSAMGLFRAVPAGAPLGVAVNDWGLLLALHALFPHLSLSIGRLLSGQKRCPRIPVSSRLTEEGRAWHGEGLFSSPRARRFLEGEYGVRGYHLDDLEGMRPALSEGEEPAGETPPPRLFVHSPFAIVTVTDRCPWIGGRSSAALPTCPRPCLGGTVTLDEPSMGNGMIQRGKARFRRVDPDERAGRPPSGAADRVLYADLP